MLAGLSKIMVECRHQWPPEVTKFKLGLQPARLSQTTVWANFGMHKVIVRTINRAVGRQFVTWLTTYRSGTLLPLTSFSQTRLKANVISKWTNSAAVPKGPRNGFRLRPKGNLFHSQNKLLLVLHLQKYLSHSSYECINASKFISSESTHQLT